MKIAQKNVGIIFFSFFFFFLLKHAPIQYIKMWERPPEIGANPTLYSTLWKKVTLAVLLLTTEKGQGRDYSSQAVFWHNKDGGLCE